MSHTFPNLQAHPTLTPNPTFQHQPLPLPLPMPQQSSSDHAPPHHIGAVALPHPTHQSPMQFLPPHPHYHAAPLPLNTNHTPDYSQHTINGSHPPPLTHENDINTSTSNDESTESHSNTKSQQNKGEKSEDDEEDADIHNNNTNNEADDNRNNVESPFGLNYAESGHNQQPIHAFASPFVMPTHEDGKKQQYFNRNNLVPSPFTMHSDNMGNNYEYHDNQREKGRNILLIPPQQPMFGYSMRNESYLSTQQQMVDVPHVVEPQIGVESDDVLAEILSVSHDDNDNDNGESKIKRNKVKNKKRKLRKRKRDRKRDRGLKKYESIKEQTANIEGSVKGGAGNGYRMVLDEPVNKSMLSCHQCKNKKTLDRIIVCGHVYRINNTVKTCTKKYCKSCLLRFYLEAPPTDNQDPTWSAWKCPCCRYICCCAWCRKKKAKRLESVSNAIRAEAHRLTPAISLARKLVSESRVNNSNNNRNNNNNNTNNVNDIPPMV